MAQMKKDAAADVDAMKDFTQQMVDSVFSFGELGFQEIETNRYLIGILKKNGFTVEEGVAGIPTAFVATWGSGKPVIALGSDIDGIPQASQKPGVAYHDPLVEGAPGHGEGHNSGEPLNITAAHRGEEDHGAREAARHDPHLARNRGGAARHEGVLRARGAVQGRRRHDLHARLRQPGGLVGRAGNGTGLVSVEYSFRGKPRTPPARRGAAAARSTPSS